jgi:hypothetical protein
MSEKEFAATKEVFLYDKDTGEFISNYQAQLCPVSKDGTYLTPIHHTEKRPPSVDVDQIAVFRADANPTEGSWLVMKDFRGKTVYNQEDNTAQTMPVIGNIPSGYALTPALKFQVAQAASELTAKIAQWRDAARNAEVEVSIKSTAYMWQVDTISLTLIKDTISHVEKLLIECPKTWRTATNENVVITVGDLNRIVAAAVMQTQEAYKHSFELKDILLKAVKKNDLAAIQKITW